MNIQTTNLRPRPRIIQSLNPLPRLPNHSLLCLSSRLSFTITRRSNRKIQPTPQPHLLNGGCLRIWRGISGSDETPCFPQNCNASRDVPVSHEHRIAELDAGKHLPLPASPLPPNIKGSRCHISKIQRRTSDKSAHVSLTVSEGNEM
jgi:hypothetical protein